MKECLICGNHQFTPVYSQTLLKCIQCGFVTANLEINEDILNKIYTSNYFLGEEYLNYIQDKEIIQLNFEKRIQAIKKVIKNRLPVTNCLEIGCAYGYFGELLRKHWPVPYKGIDVAVEAVQYGKESLKLDLVSGDYLSMQAQEKPYSDVFMWDVIEHLQLPHKFIRKISNEVLPGGRIYVTTGDFSSLLSHLQGKRWRLIHPPSHLHYFSKSNLTELLQANGFRIIKTEYLPVYRSIRQIFYSLFMLNKSKNIEDRLIRLIPEKWNIPVNTFDIVFIMAEKDFNGS
jgi:2-polyprenyl-3-methyl-5-hydroxy-6-metoxy-1,4-benzoquinol methylase